MGTSLPELLLDESIDALIAFSLDGVILCWNRGAAYLFGYSQEEALNSSFDELLVPAELREQSAALRESTDAAGKMLLGVPRKHKDGHQIYVDAFLRRVDLPDGSSVLMARNQDAAWRRQQKDQQVMEAKFQGLLEAAPDAMVIVGSDGLIKLVNGQVEQLFGYLREELLGQSVEILIPPHLRSQHPLHRNRYFSDPRARPMGAGLDLQAVRKDGSEFPAEISLAPMRTHEETLVTAAIRDVTERRQLESRMREANRLKSEFLANMSHELRTPLNAIIGFTELMYRGKVGPVSAQHQEYLGDILTSAKHLLQLINDVLDLSKVEAGKMEFRLEPVDLSRIVNEVRDVLRGIAASKQILIETAVAPELAEVWVDPARIKQILYNYLSNAIKFTPISGRVSVRLTPVDPDLFRIDVVDNGIGIAPQNLDKLFVEFQQLDASAAKKYQGTGLGLALTKRLAEAHGGYVEVRSSHGQGSTFSAILPRHMTPSSADKIGG